MKTVLHTYSYNTDTDAGPNGEWTKLHIMLTHRKGSGHCMRSLKMNLEFNPEPGEIELETEHLFENQWNSNKGRVFDWWEEVVFINGKEQRNIKRGHYLEITQEMIDIRRNTLKCRYTGMQFPISTAPRFNLTNQALGSPYLKESELYLVRLMPVCDTASPKPLTDAERDFLLPLYIEAQTKSQDKARAKIREDVIAEYEGKKQTIEDEKNGMIWLLDRGINTENVIFYSHTDTFCFGWRNPYTGEAKAKLEQLIKEFPFKWEFDNKA